MLINIIPVSKSQSTLFYKGWYTDIGNYDELVSLYLNLEKEYPDYIKVWKANEDYGIEPIPNGSYDLYFVRITNESLGLHKPEVFFSGGPHGDEAIGPITVYWFTDWLIRHAFHQDYQDSQSDWLRWLIDHREIYIEISHNPWAFHYRDELVWPDDRCDYNFWDLNREFDMHGPGGPSGGIFASNQGKVVYNFINNHLIRVGCDFHAGSYKLMYPWSSPHAEVTAESPITGKKYNYISPDFFFYDALSLRLGDYIGDYYDGDLNESLIGPFGDVLWPAMGSWGQWAYGSNYVKNPAEKIYIKQRNYPGSGICWITDEISFIRDPDEQQLGNDTIDLFCAKVRRYLLHQIDIAQPYIRWQPGTIDNNTIISHDETITFKWQVNGSLVVDKTLLQWGKNSNPIDFPEYFTKNISTYNNRYYGGTGWDKAQNGKTDGITYIENIKLNQSGDYFFVAKAMVDQIYKNVSNSSIYGNQSYLRIINERTNESYYEIINGDDGIEIINGQLWWYSPIIHITVNNISTSDDFYIFVEDNKSFVESPGILSNDEYTLEDNLEIILQQNPKHGNLSINSNGSFYYSPFDNYNGDDSFSYKLKNDVDESNIAYVQIIVSPSNDPPIVLNISGDTVINGNNFTQIQLDSYVTDIDNLPSEITWTATGQTDLLITILPTRIAIIESPNNNWNGAETITFTATDPGSLSDSDSAIFTIIAGNDPPIISNIPDQTIREGQQFTTINLNNYVTDTDNEDNEINWTYIGNKELKIFIDNNNNAKIYLINSSWFGNEIITFRATDLDGLYDECEITFYRFKKNLKSSNSNNLLTNQDLYSKNLNPVVIGSIETKNGCKTGDIIIFNGSACYDPDGNIASYLWNFGDGF
ncbi:MAG: cadherin-like domain-containing protein, partial [Candidatus Thermoplasmatota archaeon]|nr:cadherin-like domain-containing protein [Candidatus Thermoplasmatota archaeon]